MQYTAFKDSDGNIVSADFVNDTGNFSQESIPEEKACHFTNTSTSLFFYYTGMVQFSIPIVLRTMGFKSIFLVMFLIYLLKQVIKSGDSFVLKDDPTIRLTARAHKMSKSRGNVVNPDDVVSQYGADSLRLYEMFMGPFR